MKFSSSYTDQHGLTVSLAVSTSASYPEPLCEALSQPLAVADLAASAFEQAIPELSSQLVQAHSAAALALHKSYTQVLRKEVDGFEQSQGNTTADHVDAASSEQRGKDVHSRPVNKTVCTFDLHDVAAAFDSLESIVIFKLHKDGGFHKIAEFDLQEGNQGSFLDVFKIGINGHLDQSNVAERP